MRQLLKLIGRLKKTAIVFLTLALVFLGSCSLRNVLKTYFFPHAIELSQASKSKAMLANVCSVADNPFLAFANAEKAGANPLMAPICFLAVLLLVSFFTLIKEAAAVRNFSFKKTAPIPVYLKNSVFLI